MVLRTRKNMLRPLRLDVKDAGVEVKGSGAGVKDAAASG